MYNCIAVTGANGFIGSALVADLSARGYKVIALVHHMPANQLPGVKYLFYNLADTDPLFKEDVDVLIHLAFNFTAPSPGSNDVNVEAAKVLKHKNLKKYIFVSSFAAISGANSYYGQCKRHLEFYFKDDTIIRPGLVIGQGGLFGRIIKQIQKIPIVPLIAGGKQPVQIICLEDLLLLIDHIITNDIKGDFNLAHPAVLTYRQFISLVARSKKARVFLIPVPVFLVNILRHILQLFGLTTISRDSIEGLIRSVAVDTTADLQNFPVPLTATENLLKDFRP